MNKILWRDLWRSIKHTKGQFFSIFGLMLIGAFALVGLSVTGPDMRSTGNSYAQKLNTPDLNIISNYGFDKQDVIKLKKTKGLKNIEFGYMADTTVLGTNKSFRIFSSPHKVGKYELRKGKMPEKNNEIALCDKYQKKYHLGQELKFSEPNNNLKQKLLKQKKFKVVGFVRSSQILSNVNLGQSTSGTGELKGYAITPASAFQQNFYTMANLTYQNLHGLDSYGKTYTKRLNEHKKQLNLQLKHMSWAKKKRTKVYLTRKLQLQNEKLQQVKKVLTSKEKQLSSAKQKLSQISTGLKAAGISENSAQYQDLKAKQKEYKQQKAKFERNKQKLAHNEGKITSFKKQALKLPAPTYTVSNRREMPGGDGTLVYTTVAQVVDDLAKVFPIFLYFVAALVTFTTMNRFIDEERINSGTLKALGYEDKTIISKFTVYGFVSGTLGTLLGIFLGHTLLPRIIYLAYYRSITLPAIELHFYGKITIIALVLSLASSVLPAYLTAKKEFKEKPANLLLPKAPTAGSKILLEKIPFIWNHLSFTHKVTARNLFRYKKRMLMTIFGVCGAATLLFAGFAVKNSIGSINQRQFSDLIHYDMIVAQKSNITKKEKTAIKHNLANQKIKNQAPIHYTTMTKIAGKNDDSQDITLIVPKTTKDLPKYINLNQRKTKKRLHLTNHGVVLSERIANLCKVKIGDSITLKTKTNQAKKMRVTGITEMYMGHFVFMNKKAYRNIFNKNYRTNANMVVLKHGNIQNTEKLSAKFMKLPGVSGVVQNTTISKEITAVVDALNLIMLVLIVVAGLLAIVIQYNLTNINIAERIRELSTIKVLGFYNNEVTMYIYRETILLTGIGILIGYLTGDLLFKYILYIVPPDNTMFNPSLTISSFLWPLGVIGIITIILGFVVHKQLKNVDMLAALKSVD